MEYWALWYSFLTVSSCCISGKSFLSCFLIKKIFTWQVNTLIVLSKIWSALLTFTIKLMKYTIGHWVYSIHSVQTAWEKSVCYFSFFLKKVACWFLLLTSISLVRHFSLSATHEKGWKFVALTQKTLSMQEKNDPWIHKNKTRKKNPTGFNHVSTKSIFHLR